MKITSVKESLDADSFQDALESFDEEKEKEVDIQKLEEIKISVNKSRNNNINNINRNHALTGFDADYKLLNGNKVIGINQTNDRNFISVGAENPISNNLNYNSTIAKTPEMNHHYFENPFLMYQPNQNKIRNEVEVEVEVEVKAKVQRPGFKRFTRKNNYRIMPIKLNNKSEIYLNYLLFMQEIVTDGSEITISRFNCNGSMIAIGNKNGKISVFQINDYSKSSAEEFLSPQPYKILSKHTKEIYDICWSPHNSDILISCAEDLAICIWNVSLPGASLIICSFSLKDCPLRITFSPKEENLFASISQDCIVRIWDINIQQVVEWEKLEEEICSIKFSKDGNNLLVGLSKGQCKLFKLLGNKLSMIKTFDCRNRFGPYACGRKVIDIDFFSNNQALITTADNRMRIIELAKFNIKSKYKGFGNKTMKFGATISEDLNYIITPSDCGNVLVYNTEYISSSVMKGSNAESNVEKYDSYESFIPFPKEERVTNAIFAPLEIALLVSKHMEKYSPPAMVQAIIIAASNTGKIRIFYQIVEIPSNS